MDRVFSFLLWPKREAKSFSHIIIIYLLTCLLTYLFSFLLAYLLTYLITYLLTYLFTYLLTYFLTFLLTYLLDYLLTWLLTYLRIYLLTYLLTCLLTYLGPYLLMKHRPSTISLSCFGLVSLRCFMCDPKLFISDPRCSWDVFFFAYLGNSISELAL